MGMRFAAVLLLSLLLPALARADDFGPRGDVNQVRSDARRLLAHRVRVSGADPAAVKITDVVVVKDQALLSWDSGKEHGLMGLVRYIDRWWDALDKVAASRRDPCWANTIAFPLSGHDIYTSPPDPATLTGDGLSPQLVAAAARNNADVRNAPPAVIRQKSNSLVKPVCEDDIYEIKPDLRVKTAGGTLHPERTTMNGYDLTFAYARNDAAQGVKFTQVYGRAPTPGEMLPNPPPPKEWGGSTDVFLFDLMLDASRPVTFAAGTKVDIWFPFVLDDSLKYRISYYAAKKVSPAINGTIYDNVLHFELPAFTMAPGDTLMADVEGWW
jgi:hypothetical protein